MHVYTCKNQKTYKDSAFFAYMQIKTANSFKNLPFFAFSLRCEGFFTKSRAKSHLPWGAGRPLDGIPAPCTRCGRQKRLRK